MFCNLVPLRKSPRNPTTTAAAAASEHEVWKPEREPAQEEEGADVFAGKLHRKIIEEVFRPI